MERENTPVQDPETAITIAIHAISERFGAEFAERHKPYRAVLHRDEWWVMGTSDADREAAELQEKLGPDHLVQVRGGDGPEASIARGSGQVTRVSLSR